MPITIKTKGEQPKEPERPKAYRDWRKNDEFSDERFNLYGRLDMTQREIAQMERISVTKVQTLMKDSRLRAAFDAGRAECIVALRQKVLQLGLSGDTKVLLYAAKHLGKLTDDRESDVLEDLDTEAHSWEGKTRAKIEELRRKYSRSDSDNGVTSE